LAANNTKCCAFYLKFFSLIQAPDSFNYVISGGRDRRVFLTDLKQTDRQVLVCEEQYSVLRVVTTPDQQSMWVATTDSTIKNWVFIFFPCLTNFANLILLKAFAGERWKCGGGRGASGE
jgi:ABC-type nitrate/sulfonate/bicarbonate transport system ATPase subunit